MALETFPDACKIAKVKPLSKKGSKWMHQITDQYLCYFYPKSFKKFFLIKQNTSSTLVRFYMTINRISEKKNAQQIHDFVF